MTVTQDKNGNLRNVLRYSRFPSAFSLTSHTLFNWPLVNVYYFKIVAAKSFSDYFIFKPLIYVPTCFVNVVIYRVHKYLRHRFTLRSTQRLEYCFLFLETCKLVNIYLCRKWQEAIYRYKNKTPTVKHSTDVHCIPYSYIIHTHKNLLFFSYTIRICIIIVTRTQEITALVKTEN